MSISTKLYNRVEFEDVRHGMVLRIVAEGEGIKSDIEGRVGDIFEGGKWGREESLALSDYVRVSFLNDTSSSHVIKYPDYSKSSVELYEVIDAIPDEPKGVGAVVSVSSLDWPHLSRYAVKTSTNWVWTWSLTWSGERQEFNWDSISSMVLDGQYDYIKVLSEGVEL